ncbi:hypothetical protein [Flavobacterium sp. CF136]|jgi:hypothetical protein|uniref:hypothetical protein n=1 Tax=Flavobacterium sp. (strain CF136) TaxID=1144313 RepID=UPI000271747C|nr:hypothetical protein [Flavobacterium sp. CF136]EJL59210.1 hypothetical protein PMI10_04280 [Flavobacterium sp. CF136]
MKKFGITFILMLSLISCSNEDANSSLVSDYKGKWQLIEMSGSTINSVTTGSEMSWQESYVFNTNRTFVKTRIKDNTTTTASGTFSVVTILDETHLELTYSESSTLVGSCYGNLKEDLFINNNNLLVSTWQNCDGPGLVYQKKK